MPTSEQERSRTAAVLALVVAAIVGVVLGCQAVSAVAPFGAEQDPRNRPRSAPGLPPPSAVLGWGVDDGVTVDDGVVPEGASVFDGGYPAVANLDPDLLVVLRHAATAAADDGVEFSVTSGWRSPAYQDQLLREAISKYGSEDEAARWVATAETSLHVSGDAVDIGSSDATAWLSEHGAGFGLCQTYVNEPWHYELRADAVDDGCPTPYTDPTADPRLQR